MTTRWEYLVGRDFAGLDSTDLNTALDEMGKACWQLAAIDPESSRYIFRRPITDESIKEALNEYKERQ